jgi:hypothetical protein
MYRIDNSSASTGLNTPSAPGPRPNGYFSNGDPAGGIPATILEAEFMNMIQEEFANIVLSSGLALDKSDRSQVLKAIRRMFRMRLTAPLDLYVSPTGNDNGGDGLSPATAWATPQVAWNWIVANLDPALNPVTVHVAPGTYPTLVISGHVPGVQDGTIRFIGNTSNPSTTIIGGQNNAGVYVQNTTISLFGFTLSATGTPPPPHGGPQGMALVAGPGATIFFNYINFGACDTFHIFAESSGSIWNEGGPGPADPQTYTISGGAQCHLSVVEGGFIANAGALLVEVLGTPHFSNAFCFAELMGQIANFGCTYNGAATGKRYDITGNSVVNIESADPDVYYPGSIAGTKGSGGIIL